MLPACKLWDLIVIGGLEQTSHANVIFLFMAEAKSTLKNNTNMLLEKLNAEKQG